MNHFAGGQVIQQIRPGLNHLPTLVEQALDEQPKGARQLVFGIFDGRWHTLSNVGDALRHQQAVLAEEAGIWLAFAVRAFTKPWRTRCSESTDCCSTFLIGTKRIDGLLTASQIASAPAASFLLLFT